MTMRRVRVGDVVRLERRAVSVDPFRTYEEIGVRSFGKGIFHKEPVSGAALGSKKIFEVQPGDLIFSNVFAWEGAIALAGESERGRVGSHRFMTYVAAVDDVDLGYLRYFFTSEPGLGLIRLASPGSAGRNKTLSIDRFETLEIPLPSFAAQRSIAAGLDRIMSMTTALDRLEGRWGSISQAIFPALAQRPDLALDERRTAGWRLVALGDVMTASKDLHPVVRDHSYPNVGILSFGHGLFEKPPIEGSTTSARTLNRIRAGQFIYSRLFAFEGAYAEVPTRFDGSFVSNEFPTFDLNPRKARARFVAAYLRSPATWAELASSSKGLGLRRQRIQPEVLLNFRVWLPPIEAQERALATMARLAECADRRTNATNSLRALGPAVLNQAFAGLQ